MNMQYYNAIVAMEKADVDAEFLQGWQGGYLLNPKREEQRSTAAYEAGYVAGQAKDTDAYKAWVNS